MIGEPFVLGSTQFKMTLFATTTVEGGFGIAGIKAQSKDISLDNYDKPNIFRA